MKHFKVKEKSSECRARTGTLKTIHGDILTPTFCTRGEYFPLKPLHPRPRFRRAANSLAYIFTRVGKRLLEKIIMALWLFRPYFEKRWILGHRL